MDKRKLVNESSDEMEVSPDNSGLHLKSDESGEDSPNHDNPLSPVASAGHDSIESSKPVLDRSDASGDNIIQSDGSPIEDGGSDDSAIPPESSSDGSPDPSEAGCSQEVSRSSSGEQTEDDGTIPASNKRRRLETSVEDSNRTHSAPLPQSSSDGSPDQSEAELNQEASRPCSGKQTEDDGLEPASAKGKKAKPQVDEDDTTPTESSPDGSPDESESGSSQESSSSSSGSTENMNVLPDNAGTLLLDIIGELMLRLGEEAEFDELQELVDSFRKERSTKNEIHLNRFIYSMLKLEEPKECTYEKILCILLRIAQQGFFYTVTDHLSEYASIMGQYKNFRNLYERSREFVMDIAVVGAQDKDSSADKKFIQICMLRMKIAFQFLLMHIGENVNQEFMDEFVKRLLEDDVKYLKRMIA